MADPLAWLTPPCVMGILNVTPDSLWAGSGPLGPGAALERIAAMAADGAAICDVGAESTRPGSDPVPPHEQLRRLDGVLRAVRERPPAIALSIDTSSAEVAAAAIDAGAVLVNDVSAGRADPALLPLAAERGVAVCLVHMRGDPRTMQVDPRYDDVVREVRDHLARRMEAAVAARVPEGRIVLDPGLGFGKTLGHNLALLAGVPALAALGRPVLIGASRKSMFKALLGREVDERMPASVAAGLAAVARGAAVLRAHDVRETSDALRVWAAVAGAEAR
ncbi:dihydropteroate synthase [Miltoncostaea marina]|uniref:dihydropteroate synthase n=1 Tax=Miltoncostaea marina TaxID=2843215 RepID=UPI001C3E26A1|nr:dihydropteroate synthase [Miltoncostaea marina]